ncbi:hypothetical protein M409DRAFT_29855 [Zasmidium cellare ATCC 36951]|uniref:Alpha/beta hydrolase fold-3 domain-containing protein n=1 Tax=Zasmidium cellare ATCC 36951 TaxID=1080233 RepID=A0A6A6BYI9_ZASCE|nr:uncharacterized protein M409DRAFT_29855 [Zasmidium cellare ATCC 36951]KAF2159693.1 hypothetical protein M409DRAFT_29855 [Zasmidium cellare ATCC 36951]
MPGILTMQPVKGIWTLLAVAINLARFPLWILYYIPPFLRPHPKWSLRQCIQVQIVKNFLWNAALVEMKTPLSLAPQAEKERWEVVQPADKALYVKVAASDPEIRPGAVGGTWYPAKPSVPGKPGIVICHFHGGAYVIGDGRTKDAGFAAKTLIANSDATHVFAPQYRLSSNPGNQFPAALQDAISAYAYLVKKEGIAANRIVLSGDSAGANLALSLTKYLTENGSSIGLDTPLATLLWSPWVSPGRSVTTEAFNSSPNVSTDYITAEFGRWGALTYRPSPRSGLTLEDPYIHFTGNPFRTPVPIYVSTGECEVLFHDDVKLAEEFKAVAGNKVELQIEEYSVHDTILAGPLLGFEKEAQQAAKRAGKWLRTIS